MIFRVSQIKDKMMKGKAMKLIGFALVLVLGAGIILFVGNTSSAWVVGGLTGGFSAFLISVPFAFVLFRHLSKQNDLQEVVEFSQDTIAVYEDTPKSISSRRSQQYLPASNYVDDESFNTPKSISGRRSQQYLPTSNYDDDDNFNNSNRYPKTQPPFADYDDAEDDDRRTSSRLSAIPRRSGRLNSQVAYTAALQTARQEAVQYVDNDNDDRLSNRLQRPSRQEAVQYVDNDDRLSNRLRRPSRREQYDDQNNNQRRAARREQYNDQDNNQRRVPRREQYNEDEQNIDLPRQKRQTSSMRLR